MLHLGGVTVGTGGGGGGDNDVDERGGGGGEDLDMILLFIPLFVLLVFSTSINLDSSLAAHSEMKNCGFEYRRAQVVSALVS